MAARMRNSLGESPLDVSNVIAAFSEEHVERIAGLSVGRLRSWAKTDFFKPSFLEDNPHLPYSRFYSFKDVVALRTLEMLRVQNNVPLQHLRKVAEQLKHLKDELWTTTELFVFNRRVIFANPETGDLEEVVSGQYLLGIPLRQVIEDTNKDIARLRHRSSESVGKLRKSRSIARNEWAIAGTRITVGAVKRLHEDGYSIARIIKEYPDLTREDVQAALEHDESQAA